MKELFIVGAADPGREILDLIEAIGGYRFVGFFDEHKTGEGIHADMRVFPSGASFVISIGDVSQRARLFALLVEQGFEPETVVAPGAWVSPRARLGRGVLVYPNCSISHGAEIGENVLVNFNASISHGVIVGAHSNICPGVNVAGDVRIGEHAFLGIGSSVRERATIASGAYLGAGATVVRDIEEAGVYVGTPCRFLRHLTRDIDVPSF